MMKILNKGLRVVLFLTFIIFMAISIVSVFNSTFDGYLPIVTIIGVIVLAVFLKFLKVMLSKLDDNKSNVLGIILCLLFFLLLNFIGINVKSSPVTDLSHITEYASQMISDNTKVISGDYFSKYPNQIPLLMVVYGIFKLANVLGSSAYSLFGLIFNALAITITAWFVYKSVSELKDKKSGLLALIIMMLNPIFYLYSSYYYTDTLCMPFALIGFYLIIKALKSDDNKKYLWLILSGIVFYLGYKIRVVVLILLLGVIIYLVVKHIKGLLKILGSMAIGLVLGSFLFNVYYNTFDVSLDSTSAFPLTHWVMMGLNTEHDGGYNNQDHDITYYSDDKVNTNITEIKLRLNNLGITGYLKLMGSKLARTWTNGNYGVFAKITNSSNTSSLYNYLGGYGNATFIVGYVMQIMKVAVNLGFAAFCFKAYKNKETGINTSLVIALFGAVVFYLIWEATARYSLSFLPWMIVAIASSDLEFNIKACNSKWFKGSLLLVTLILLTIGFFKYTKVSEYNDYRVVSYRGFSSINIDDNVTQSFTTNQVFNEISIKFKKLSEDTSNYVFRLYQEDNLLEEIYFSSSDITSGYYDFTFNNVTPTDTLEYNIEIVLVEGDSNLSIVSYSSSSNYILLDNTKVTVNGIDTNDTLIFNVTYKNKRSQVNKLLYIALSTVIILIEVVSLKKGFDSDDSDK